MASVVYNELKRMLFAAELDLDSDDIRVALVMTNTTVDSENDGIVNLDDFTTLDECDGANYVRKALTSETITKDDSNDQAEFDADDVTWSALGAGTRSVQGMLVYKYVDGTAANDIALFYLEFAAVKTPDGSDFTVNFATDGLLALGDAA